MWTDEWVGIPYKKMGRGPDGYDCLGLWLALLQHRKQLSILDPGCSLVYAVRAGVVDQYRPQFEQVSDVQEGDALLFFASGHAVHLGYALNRTDMLHTYDDATGCSRIERWTSPRWRGKLEGAYRIVR